MIRLDLDDWRKAAGRDAAALERLGHALAGAGVAARDAELELRQARERPRHTRSPRPDGAGRDER